MAVPLETTITRTGLQQSDLVKLLENMRDLVNELKTDYTALLADVTAIRTSFNTAMTKLNADAGVTDTNYAAAAALTATAIAAADLTLNKG